MRITRLKTIDMTCPLGIDRTPYFSWILTSDESEVKQIAYQLIVADDSGIVWDTGKTESDAANYIEYTGKQLSSKTRYSWTVAAWDNKGNKAEESSAFETANLSHDDWKADWAESALPLAKRKKGFGHGPPATLFRKSFKLIKTVASARLYATCRGIYRLTINGQRPDNREFAPEHTVYGKYLCYQTYDVTGLLENGENAIGMYVGDGWFCGRRTRPKGEKKNLRHAVFFQMDISYEDGSKASICSDANVATAHGPVCSSDLFSGEKYDANLELQGWDTAVFDDSKWAKAKVAPYGTFNLKAQIGEPVKPIKELPAVEVFTSPKGETIVDFGEMLTGHVRMKLNATKGTEIKIDHFEVLDKDGNYFNNLAGLGGGKGNEQMDVYVSSGEAAIYEPFFTFHGFRYIRVAGLQDVRAEDFTAIVLTSANDDLGSFSCSDERLNKLYENTRRSQWSNMLSIPTDCPHREKAGWTGDIQIYATTSLLNEDTTAFLTRWLENLAHDQYENGGIPFVVPNVGFYPTLAKICNRQFGGKGPASSAGWGDAAVLVPYSMYQITGNTNILKQQYPSMKSWCQYIINTAQSKRGKNKKVSKEIDQYLWNTGFHFGEWLIPSYTKKGYGLDIVKQIKASLQYTAPIYGYFSISSMAKIARILGNREDESYFADMADKIKDAIGKGVIGKNGDMPIELMGAYVLPLYFDLVPEQHKEHFAKKLMDMLEKNSGCLDTGFLGTPFILDALCKIGSEDAAFKLLYQEKCPSWLYEVSKGATSIWESWYGYADDGNPMVISYNHYAFGCVDDWIFRYISGVSKALPGFKHIVIEPRPDSSLTWAKRRYRSVFGDIVSNWKREGGLFILEVEIPCNTTATVKLPDGSVHEVGSGRYQYKVSC